MLEHRSYGFSQRVSYLTHAVKGTKPHRRFWDKPEPDLFERLPKQAHEAMSVLERCPLSPVGMCWGDGRAHDVLWRTRKASEGLQHRRIHAAHGPTHELLMIGQGDGALVLAAPAAACPHTGSADLLIMWEHFPKLVEPTLWNGWHGTPTQERKAWEMAWHFFRSGMGPQEAASEAHDIIFD